MFLGWTEYPVILRTLDDLRIAPHVDPRNGEQIENLGSFLETQYGYDYARDEIQSFNRTWKTSLELQESGVLIWKEFPATGGKKMPQPDT